MSRASRPSARPSSASDAGAATISNASAAGERRSCRCRRTEVRERDARIARPLQNHTRKVLAGDRERIGSQIAMDGAQVAAIAFEEDAVAAWRVREDCRLAAGLADIVRKKQRVGPAGKLPLHAGQGGLLHRDGPPRRAAGACVLAPIRRVQAKAVGRSRRWGVFHFENGDYRKESQDPCANEKQAQFTRLARPLSC